MSFAHINEIAYKAGISTKSVYNYLAKHSDIETEKRGGKTYVNREQFQNYFQHSPNAKENNNAIPAQASADENEVRSPSQPVQKGTKDLPVSQKLEQVEAEKESLLKVNNNLETNLQKYAIMLSDEKTEKQLRIEKYNETNGKYIEKIEESAQDKIRYSRVVFGLLALIGMIAVAVGLIYYFNIKP